MTSGCRGAAWAALARCPQDHRVKGWEHPSRECWPDCNAYTCLGRIQSTSLFPFPLLSSLPKSWKWQRPKERAEMDSWFVSSVEVGDNRGLPRETVAPMTLTKFNRARPDGQTAYLQGLVTLQSLGIDSSPRSRSPEWAQLTDLSTVQCRNARGFSAPPTLSARVQPQGLSKGGPQRAELTCPWESLLTCKSSPTILLLLDPCS